MLGITNVSNAPSIVLKDTIVSSWTSGSYNGYSYRGAIPITGVTADTIAEVTFSQAQAESGNYSSVCTTYDGGLYIYAKVNTTITIPSIIIHSIVETYYEMDNSPVSGSTKAVTSGGVYTTLKTTEITGLSFTDVTGSVKAYRSGNIVQVCFAGANITASNETFIISGLPKAKYNTSIYLVDWNSGTHAGLLAMMTGETRLRRYGSGNVGNVWITLTYMVDTD